MKTLLTAALLLFACPLWSADLIFYSDSHGNAGSVLVFSSGNTTFYNDSNGRSGAITTLPGRRSTLYSGTSLHRPIQPRNTIYQELSDEVVPDNLFIIRSP